MENILNEKEKVALDHYFIKCVGIEKTAEKLGETIENTKQIMGEALKKATSAW